MKKWFNYMLLCLALASLPSCKKWLDVRPEDKFTEADLYTNASGFEDAMNGLYLQCSSTNMYGARLTMTTMDALAKLYHLTSENNLYQIANYNYGDASSLSQIDATWSNLYKAILNMNKLLQSLETYGNVLDLKTRNMYKGEVLALRAFCYFDLMRMFTKPYALSPTDNVLPYYDKATYEISDFKSNAFIMERILKDLGDAEQLLQQNDPAVTQAQVSKATLSLVRNSRNYRMNYYAVKALQARVNLWKDDKPAALAAAQTLIANQAKFPWTEFSDLNISESSNKVFATEMIFGIESTELTKTFNDNFAPSLLDGKILAGNPTGAFISATIFEGFASDYRFQFVWKIDGKPYYTFFKYKNGSNVSQSCNNTIPLIKMGEMYLIAAECETDPAKALDNLNALRTHRGIAALVGSLSTTQLNDRIMREYRKEFYGEGQLFFYYKRKQMTSVAGATNNVIVSMSPSNYTFPIPLSETRPR
ncbi:RagB/SusD family nutrient uptake outer membrane protein [Pedobacter sp. KR3-3]|uniref:RagB/SusD family nutrient uptake outer membrane protein n=1 Tax=Pedobacter albus TaxID=3113905 RepID=A0ABU7I4E4_9SPHI|nr:RagB/SusD family nutrient uptake outer membrane protein [Pedobacter sp. KR3-3]MEE1944201.1 RagB/SusD family nutrient uptake outer membrane protein [Pedobacter sp. KR3-3]